MQKYCKIIGAEISNIEKNTLFASLGKMSGEIENWQKSDREILSDFPLNEEKNIIYQGVNSLIMKVEIGIYSKTKKKETRGKLKSDSLISLEGIKFFLLWKVYFDWKSNWLKPIQIFLESFFKLPWLISWFSSLEVNFWKAFQETLPFPKGEVINIQSSLLNNHKTANLISTS